MDMSKCFDSKKRSSHDDDDDDVVVVVALSAPAAAAAAAAEIVAVDEDAVGVDAAPLLVGVFERLVVSLDVSDDVEDEDEEPRSALDNFALIVSFILICIATFCVLFLFATSFFFFFSFCVLIFVFYLLNLSCSAQCVRSAQLDNGRCDVQE